ncbi:MAG TPA: DUF5777 family beta-barrel protein [Thermoanaerobaculia bacterium]
MRTLSLSLLLAVACAAAASLGPARAQDPPGGAPATAAAASTAAAATDATAADTAAYEPIPRDPLGTRNIDIATPYTVGRKRFELLFNHRFDLPVQKGSSHDLWGLDSGADIGLGLTAGLTDHLDLSVFRSSFQENFELAGKFLIFEQAPRVPISIALRAGADLIRRPGVADPHRPFVQLLLARRLYPGIDLLVSPSWVRDTPLLRNAWNVPVGLTFPIPGDALLKLEYIAKNRDLKSSVAAWHAALSKAIGGHYFELVVGNSRATTVDQILGGDSAAGFEKGDVRLGFNLVRYFG